ncbi:MAG TPA: tripartite tricarboxylate transporter substrate binding protein [Ramlibacter sp.]|nr:tripartite tricarboxylate transporter substrate binding protein [Ramlibacter sp.]
MTPRFTRRQALAALAASCTPWLAPSAGAAGYPTRPVKLLVGAVPGGPSDFLARVFADTVGPVLGQSFVVENKAGASGTLAADAAVKSPADGHTLLVTGPAAISVAPHLFPKLNYDPAADLVPISMLGAGAFVLAVHPSLPVKNVQELIAHARARPGTISFGSGGNGSSGHLCTELFSQMAGVKMLHVPYKGDGQALNDLLAGQIQLMFTAPNVAMQQVKAGKLRLLAVTTRERVASIDAPTVHESGLRDFEYLGWIVTFAPKDTPKPVLETLVAAWNKVRNTPAVKAKLEDLAMVAPERLVTGEPLQQFVRAESARLAKVIRDAGIKVD